jgi:hypothetical protein
MKNIDEHKCISYLGSEEEINISLDLIDGYAMDDYDFIVETYCSSYRKQTFRKRDARRVDANNYKIIVDTNIVGVGDMKIRVIARIPNIEYPDGYREAVTYLDPNVTVKR